MNQTTGLPKIDFASSTSGKEDDVANPMDSLNKSVEFMMMKRLHFLRNSLEQHNPQETTNRLRENAERKRDERILELWRKDKSKPSVQELVQNSLTYHSQGHDDYSINSDMPPKALTQRGHIAS